jgi:hypothetical protein
MSRVIKQHLLRAQQRMKFQADKKRSEVHFQVGDQVFLKLQPYVRSSVADKAHHKLAFKFFGPYTILEKVGSVAYKLALPATSSIHPVFHVSQLKKVVSNTSQVSASWLCIRYQNMCWGRLVRRGESVTSQVLIKWNGMSKELATWENEGVL